MKDPAKNWLGLAKENYDTSWYLFKGARHPHAVYHLCQAIENILKAALVEITEQVPPKSHDLEHLARKSGLPLSEDQYGQLDKLYTHYKRVRYRDLGQAHYNTKAKVKPIMNQGKQIYLWILTELKNH